MTEDFAPVQADYMGRSIADVAAVLHFPVQAIQALHIVQSLFAAHQGALVQCVNDYINDPTEAMVMLEAECLNQYFPPPPDEIGIFHTLLITRNRHSFASLAAILHLTRYVELFAPYVTVFHNGAAWSPTDGNLRRLQHGDHLRVEFAPPSQEDKLLVSPTRSHTRSHTRSLAPQDGAR